MEFFVGSIALFPVLRVVSNYHVYIYKYSRRPIAHSRDDFYEICHSSKVNKDFYQKLKIILNSHPHVPSFIELIDFYGQYQTLFSSVVRSFLASILPVSFSFIREYVVMSDGGTIALDWAVPNGQSLKTLSKQKIVIILHGMLGSSKSEYIFFIVPQLIAAGYTPVVYISRGCDNLVLTSDSLYNGKVAPDFYEIIRYIKIHYQSRNLTVNEDDTKEEEERKLYAIGYSLGGIALLNYLARLKENSFLTAAVSVCPPLHLNKATNGHNYTETFLSRFFSFLIAIPVKLYFLRHYKTLFKFNPALQDRISLWKVLTSSSVFQYDIAMHSAYYKSLLDGNYQSEKYLEITEKSLSFKKFLPIRSMEHYSNVYDYYYDGTPSNDNIGDIAIPTLTLVAKDDPVCPDNNIPSGNECEVFGPNLLVVRINGSFLFFVTFFVSFSLGENEFRWSSSIS
jgi:predicted alpha/beta-fold hydrolase